MTIERFPVEMQNQLKDLLRAGCTCGAMLDDFKRGFMSSMLSSYARFQIRTNITEKQFQVFAEIADSLGLQLWGPGKLFDGEISEES